MSFDNRSLESAEGARERVRAASDVVEIVGQYVTLKKTGRTWKGLCPFHQEKTPSFTVSPERQTYHCFGCGAGGDVFRFVQEVERLTFPEALRHLAERAGIELPRYEKGSGEAGKLYEICEEAARLYRRCLLDPALGRQARDLLRRRGIGEEVEERFGLGFAPPGWDFLTSRLERAFGRDALRTAGLALERETGGVYDRFRERLVVPLRLPSGRVVGFGGRATGDEEPKYLNSPETPVYRKGQFLFGLGEARGSLRDRQEAVLVEGYFDCLVLHQAGFTAAVAAAGTAVTADQARLLARYVERVVVALDGDAAGQTASRRALGPLLSAGVEVRVARLPVGDDPDSFVRERGAAAFAEALEAAASPAAFLCATAGEGAAAHAEAVARVLELAAQIEGLAAREAVLVDADRHLGVGVDRLRRELEGRAARPRGRETAGAANAVPPATPGPEAVGFLERSLLGLLIASAEARRAAFDLPPEWLLDARSREILGVLVAAADEATPAWLGRLSPGAQEVLGRAEAEAVLPPDPLRVLGDHRRRLEARGLAAEREVWRRKLAAREVAAETALARMQAIAERLSALSGGEVEAMAKGEAE